MYTFLERKFHEKYNGDINFYQKLPFLRKSQKTCFLSFFYQKNRLQKIEILKIAFRFFFDLKHPPRCCVFLFLRIFVDFFNFMPNKVKKIEKFVKKWNFCLIWHETQKLSKNSQNEKTQHLNV